MPKELILNKDVAGLGIAGDVVKVADGYARNFLVPRNLAQPVTMMARRQLEKLQAEREARLVRERDGAEKVAAKLEKVSLTLTAKTGPEGKLYGSITPADIATALEAKKIIVDRHKIDTGSPIRELGEFVVTAKLHPEVQASFTVVVVEE